MTDLENQPPPLEAHWDRDQVAALFADLEQGAEVQRVQVRTSGGNPGGSTVTLEEARRLLADNRVQALQIYYDYDGQSWCDTLIPSPDKIRIIRATIPSDR